MTESGFQPIGVAVSCFSIKPPAKGIKGYRAFAAPVFELPQVVLIVKKTSIKRHTDLVDVRNHCGPITAFSCSPAPSNTRSNSMSCSGPLTLTLIKRLCQLIVWVRVLFPMSCREWQGKGGEKLCMSILQYQRWPMHIHARKSVGQIAADRRTDRRTARQLDGQTGRQPDTRPDSGQPVMVWAPWSSWLKLLKSQLDVGMDKYTTPLKYKQHCWSGGVLLNVFCFLFKE